jgi:hypothetical protein
MVPAGEIKQLRGVQLGSSPDVEDTLVLRITDDDGDHYYALSRSGLRGKGKTRGVGCRAPRTARTSKRARCFTAAAAPNRRAQPSATPTPRAALALSDAQLANVMDISRQLPPWARSMFLQELAQHLRTVS